MVKARSESSLQLKFGKKQRLNDKIGIDSDCELDDGQLKKKVRRKEERKNSKGSVKFIAEKRANQLGMFVEIRLSHQQVAVAGFGN